MTLLLLAGLQDADRSQGWGGYDLQSHIHWWGHQALVDTLKSMATQMALVELCGTQNKQNATSLGKGRREERGSQGWEGDEESWRWESSEYNMYM